MMSSYTMPQDATIRMDTSRIARWRRLMSGGSVSERVSLTRASSQGLERQRKTPRPSERDAGRLSWVAAPGGGPRRPYLPERVPPERVLERADEARERAEAGAR